MVSPSNDASAIAILRLTLDELFTDHQFFVRKSMSAGQIADFILTLVQRGERNLDVLKGSAFKRLSGAPPAQERISDSSAAALDTARRLGIIQ
jgi:hypothetical protein